MYYLQLWLYKKLIIRTIHKNTRFIYRLVIWDEYNYDKFLK